MAEGSRAANWKHTSSLLLKLHQAHFQGEASLKDFDPYWEEEDQPETPVRMVSITALKDVFIDKKMPQL